MEDSIKFNPQGKPITKWFVDPSDRINKWGALEGKNSCAFDFISSSAILEWMAKYGAIKIDNRPDARFQRYRHYSTITDPNHLIHQLVLFDKIYLNTGQYYLSHMDLSGLQRYGIFEEYPRPPEVRFFDAYRLIQPLALQGLNRIFPKIMGVPFDRIWTNEKMKNEFKNYENLIAWLYTEYAKDACGLDSHEMALYNFIYPNYIDNILDFIEFAVHAQGCLASGNLPMFSSIIQPITHDVLNNQSNILSSAARENVFALYQFASKDVLGHFVALDSFEQLLRLREDKNIVKIRKLLGQYLYAIDESDEKIKSDITTEIADAKKALDKFSFQERPLYSFVVKAITYIPTIGIVANVINDAFDLAKAWQKRKHGWIYFGLK